MPVRTVSRALALVLGLVWSLTWAGTAAAQAREEEKANVTVTGEVVAVDPAARRIVVKSTEDNGLAYDVDSAATIMSEADKIALGDVKAGWSVVMNGHRARTTTPANAAPVVTYIKVVKRPMP